MNIKVLITTLFLGYSSCLVAQTPAEKVAYSLEDIIQLAKDQSPDAMRAKHSFRASYWEYRTYKADLLPSLSLNATVPEFNRSLKKYQLADGTYSYIEENSSSASGSLMLNQNIGLTGGSIFASSELMRTDQLGSNRTTSFFTSPFIIGFKQPISGYNSFRWKRKIEPLKYEAARRRYLQEMENVSIKAVNLFFNLLVSQQQLEVSEINYANSDTLYKISKGRYNIGTIAENELLQMELSNLNAGKALNQARIQLEIQKYQIRSFLGFNDKVDIELKVPAAPPVGELVFDEVMAKVGTNNPDLLSYEKDLLESQERVALARSQRGFQADLYARYGMTKQASSINDAYRDPQEQQRISVGIQIPILDWGLGRGKVEMAKSNLELVKTKVQQSRVDFNQQVFLKVMQYNMEDDQLFIATKADTIAQKRYEVTKQRFLIGKITVLDLNIAQNERDAAKISYLGALSSYWESFYTLQSIALYDFARNKELETDFDALRR